MTRVCRQMNFEGDILGGEAVMRDVRAEAAAPEAAADILFLKIFQMLMLRNAKCIHFGRPFIFPDHVM